MTFRPIFSLFALPFLTLAGCAPQETSPVAAPTSQTAAPRAIVFPTDDLGRAVVKKVPQRVACIGPGATEIVYALGAGNRLVGRDESSDYPAAAKKAAIIGNFSGPFLESLIAARPDLLIVQGETYDRARVEVWQKKAGVPIAVINARTVKELERDIEKISVWLDMPNKITIPKVLSSVPATRAFLEISRAPLWTAGDDTLAGDALKYANVENVAGKVLGYKVYNLESLIAQNPKVYVITSKLPRAQAVKQLQNQAGLKNLEAIRKGRIAIVDPDLFSRPGPRLKEGIETLKREVMAASQR